jgi:hypothetical protein
MVCFMNFPGVNLSQRSQVSLRSRWLPPLAIGAMRNETQPKSELALDLPKLTSCTNRVEP